MINGLVASSILGSGSSSGYTPVAIDLSVLYAASSGSYGSGLDIGTAPPAFTTPSSIAPWVLADPDAPVDLRARLNQTLGLKSLVDQSGTLLSGAGDDPDLKTSFTLYKTLDNLRTLAEAASTLSLTATERTRADARFRDGLQDLRAFMATAPGDKLDLLFAGKKTSIDSVVAPRASLTLDGKLVSAERSAALTVASGTEQIRIRLGRNGSFDSVTVDLATISGPLTLDALADAINGAIESFTFAGADGPVTKYSSRVEVYRGEDGGWGLRAKGALLETFEMHDVSAPPATLLAGTVTPLEGTAGGRLARIDWHADAPVQALSLDFAGKDTAASNLAKSVADDALATKKAAQPGLAGALPATPDTTVRAPTRAGAVAVDSTGAVYALSTSAGDFGAQLGSGDTDVVLQKFDSQGNLLFTRLLGAGGTTEGFALAIDAADNVIVGGRTEGRWSGTDAFAGADSFIAKFASDGSELFHTQLDSLGEDGVRGLAVGADGRIFAAGVIKGSMGGTSPIGAQDGYLAEINATTGAIATDPDSGTRLITRFGSAASDDIAGVAVAGDGTVYIASTEDGSGVVRAFDGAALTTAPDVLTLGSLGGGRMTSIAFDEASGQVVAGGATEVSLSGGGGAANVRSDGLDGFVTTLATGGGLAAERTTYIGGAGSDQVTGVQVRDGMIYAAGQTGSDLDGARRGKVDGFVSRIDLTTGAIARTVQIGRPGETMAAPALAQAAHAPGLLGKLGLRAGTQTPQFSNTLTAATALRVGDSFQIIANGGTARKITIGAGETMLTLARKIGLAAPGIKALSLPGQGGDRLQLAVKDGNEVRLVAGPEGRDVLTKLGLGATRLLDANTLYDIGGEASTKGPPKQSPGGAYALDLSMDLSLADKSGSAWVLKQVDNAIGKVQSAYKSLYYDPLKAQLAQDAWLKSNMPAGIANQISSYQDALSRLQGGASSSVVL